MAKRLRDTDTVVRWRRTQLTQAGFPSGLAARVARDERYGLQELIELVEYGCPPAQAVRILEPIGRTDETLAFDAQP